jgi:hypothetical protein
MDTRPHAGQSGIQLPVGARDFSPNCPNWLWNPYSLLFKKCWVLSWSKEVEA